MLTSTAVQDLEPTTKNQRICDGNGLYLRGRKTASKSWMIRRKRQGRTQIRFRIMSWRSWCLLPAVLWFMLFAGHVHAQAQSTLLDDPTFSAFGFADMNYVTGDNQSKEGFVLGQLVGHAVARVSDRLNLFSEVTATGRDSEYKFEVERLIAKYDFSDRYMLSAGRYHTPIGYWNTSFHHGTWLQTTVGRPSTSRIIPIHFVGLELEGKLPGERLGLAYRIGVGNGRHGNITRAGDAGDINSSRAFSLSLDSRPISINNLNAGISFYSDRVTPPASLEVDEEIFSVYAAWENETPEVIAEYVHASHAPTSGAGSSDDTDAFYVQVAYRLPARMQQFKPYVRVEEVDVGDNDPLLGGLGLDYEAVIAGVRFDFSPSAALKFEYHSEKFDNGGREDNFIIQLSMLIGGR